MVRVEDGLVGWEEISSGECGQKLYEHMAIDDWLQQYTWLQHQMEALTADVMKEK